MCNDAHVVGDSFTQTHMPKDKENAIHGRSTIPLQRDCIQQRHYDKIEFTATCI